MTEPRNTSGVSSPPAIGMATLIEMLANKKKPAGAPAAESAVILPLLEKAHAGACGEGCGCEGSEGGGCCSA